MYTTLQEKNITLQAIPEFLEEQKQQPQTLPVPIPIFTGITKKEKIDHYEKIILNFFKKYEHHSLENLYIRDREIIEIEDAFDKGHFSGDKLLGRIHVFQAIQQKNFMQYYKRMYRYGGKYGQK